MTGTSTGDLDSIASEKAFSQWVSSMVDVVDIIDTIDDPMDAVSGLLSGLDTDGVELQHSARKTRARGLGRAHDGH
jgi:hypothetical protein